MTRMSFAPHAERMRSRAFGSVAVVLFTGLLGLAGGPAAAADAKPDWEPIGRMGMVQYVVVPESMARERSYYDAIIGKSCPPVGTCFMRFFTNSSGVPATLPLPDAIQNEPAALFQRSSKRGSEEFRFACRLQVSGDLCF